MSIPIQSFLRICNYVKINYNTKRSNAKPNLKLLFTDLQPSELFDVVASACRDNENAARARVDAAEMRTRHHLLLFARRLELVPHHSRACPEIPFGVVPVGARVDPLHAAPDFSAVNVRVWQSLEGRVKKLDVRHTTKQLVGHTTATIPSVGVEHRSVDGLVHGHHFQSVHLGDLYAEIGQT